MFPFNFEYNKEISQMINIGSSIVIPRTTPFGINPSVSISTNAPPSYPRMWSTKTMIDNPHNINAKKLNWYFFGEKIQNAVTAEAARNDVINHIAQTSS